MKNVKLLLFTLLSLQVLVSFGQEKDVVAKMLENKIPNELIVKNIDTLKNFRTHCLATINKKDKPQYIVDGKPVSESFIKKINPNDIESINVLKESEKGVKSCASNTNGTVLITMKKLPKKESNKKAIKIKGVVTDCEGNPLAGVSVLVMSKKNATITSFDGEYSIKANKNDILNYTLVGMESQNVEIKEQTKIDVKLKESTNKLKDTVIIAKKPIIYLYPTAKTDITLELDFKGKLHTTFPEYTDKWDVTAYPDGRIFDKKTKRFYASLFWDGEFNFSQEHYSYKDGFVVAKKDLTSFLIEKLEFMGLNNSETNEFVQYWLPILEKNETNCIHFLVNADYNVISRNIIEPKPETELRIFMEFYAVDKTLKIPEQNLRKTERRGFTLVEWGGSDVSNAVHKLNKNL
jgi:CarboxypepD_reg-like domain